MTRLILERAGNQVEVLGDRDAANLLGGPVFGDHKQSGSVGGLTRMLYLERTGGGSRCKQEFVYRFVHDNVQIVEGSCDRCA